MTMTKKSGLNMNRIAVCIGLAITLLIPAIVNAIEIDIEDSRATVTGTVYSVNTGETVPFATVRVVGTRIGAVSNEKGIYQINGLPPGEWQLKISLLGYKEITREINVAANDIHRTDIYIKEVPIPMAEVEVRGESSQDEKLASVDTGSDIDLSIIGSRPGMVDDLLRQVQELPQVKARSDFSSKMYVRGSGPEHNIVYIDGIPAYNPYRAFGVVSSFNPDLVEKARLYPGGFPAEFGGRLSAVLDVKYKSGTKKKIKPSLDINALAAGGILEGPLFSDNNTYIISGRRTYYDLFLDSRDAHTVYPHFYDMYSKITFGKNSKNRVDILGWHNGEGFRLSQNKDESDDRSYYARATNSGYSTAQSVNWKHMHSQSLMFETRLYNVGENRKLNMIGDIAADFDSYFKETALEGQALWMNNFG
ncbi:MAG: TonB-dependent receptor plug domain-containing protein, partial [candidate division Zixibacteria bacterium]|nr:TonB-dependent receptor plug domain-containing protein [candidate division Zixibacteria bacterium]